MQPFIRILISAVLIYLISEVGRRSSLLGALLASLPVTSILAMVWLYHDTHDAARIADFSQGVFWLVLPSLVLFLLLPILLTRGHLPFPLALLISCLATIGAYLAAFAVLGRFGVKI